MKSKKHIRVNEENGKTKDETAELADSKECVDEKASLNAKIDELNDKYLRLYSEFDNYRKRTLKERIDLSKTATEDLIVDLLPILDDFARAEKSFDVTDNHQALLEGVQLIHNKLKGTLSAKGLKEISSKGETFNTDFHEAVTHFPAEDPEMKNRVIDEIVSGYMLNEKVIRFAKVVVGS